MAFYSHPTQGKVPFHERAQDHLNKYGQPPGAGGQSEGPGLGRRYAWSLGSTQGLQVRGGRDFGVAPQVPGANVKPKSRRGPKTQRYV